MVSSTPLGGMKTTDPPLMKLYTWAGRPAAMDSTHPTASAAAKITLPIRGIRRFWVRFSLFSNMFMISSFLRSLI